MGEKSADLVLNPFGRLFAGVSGAPATWTTTGTELGVYEDLVFMPNVGIRRTRGYEDKYNRVTTGVIMMGEMPVVGVTLRQWDEDVYNAVCVGAENTGMKGLVTAGTNLASLAQTFAFIPEDTTAWPALLLYNAIPVLDETAEITISAIEEMVLQTFWHALPDSSDRVYKQDLLANMPTLS